MFSFRYHLVSIVAVFLALALGVLVGTTVVNQGVIDDLERRTDAAVTNADELRRQVGQLQEELQGWREFGLELQPLLISGVLAGRTAVLVTLEGVDLAEVDGVRRVLQQSGAEVKGILVATDRLALEEETQRADLAQVLGSSQTKPPDELAAEAAARLGVRLAVGAGTADEDLLEVLMAREYLALRGASVSASEIGGNGEAIILVAGGDVLPAVRPEVFLTPLGRSLVNLTRRVVAAETVETVYPFVQLVRSDGILDAEVVTVDNADTLPGHVALVLALRDLVNADGRGADYGVKDGASTLLPAPS